MFRNTCACAYLWVRIVSFTKNFANVLDERFLMCRMQKKRVQTKPILNVNSAWCPLKGNRYLNKAAGTKGLK